MHFSAQYHPAMDEILVSVKGTIDSRAAVRIASEVKQLAQQQTCDRILMDLRGANLTTCPYDIRLMIDLAETIGFDKSLRRALIVTSRLPGFLFLKWLARFQGHRLEIFTCIDHARQWLSGPLANR